VKTLFADNFASDPIGCLGPVASTMPGAGAASGAASTVTGTASSAAGSVTGTVSGITGSLPAAGSLTGTVTSTVTSTLGSVTGTACSLGGTVGGAAGTLGGLTDTVNTVTGTISGVTGTVGSATSTLPGGWIVGGSLLPAVVDEGGQHVLTHLSRSWSFLAAGSASWSDYSVSSAIRTDAGTGDAGVAARYQDPNNYYACEIVNGTTFQMVKMVAGKLQILTSTAKAIVGPGAFNTIGMVVKGSHLGCIVNGSTVLQAVDGALSHGQFALVGLDSLPAEFGLVKVLSLPTA
jgi:hypothetical protein